MHGWAVPVATDIAFALLTIFGKRLPTALRAFLLTLAVVDDLLGIVVIAVFYANSLQFAWLGAVLATITVFAVLVRRRGMTAWVLVPLAIAAWGFMHASGIHATIAVLIGSLTAAMLGGILLTWRSRVHMHLQAAAGTDVRPRSR